jgi:hypothetical protein
MPTHHWELWAGQNFTKICTCLMMAKGQKDTTLADGGEVLWISAQNSQFLPSNRSMPRFIKSFWDSLWSPGSRRRILMENMSSGRFATVHTAKTTQQFLAESWTSVYWLPFLLDFLSREFFRRKPRWCLLSIWPPYVCPSPTEWDWLAMKYICKTCHSFQRRQEAAVAKYGVFIK